jgi:trans-aconitate methyltransferase
MDVKMDPRDIHECTRRAYNDVADLYQSLFKNELAEKPFDREYLDRFSRLLPNDACVCDAGCGPSAQYGRYLFDKHINVFGIDISDRCIELARQHDHEMKFVRTDFLDWDHPHASLDAIISYYSIIYTPKKFLGSVLNVFKQKLKPRGWLLIVVKKGEFDGFQDTILGVPARSYWAEYQEDELRTHIETAEFAVQELIVRAPYEDEINNDRIYCLCTTRD